jgi:hypothetical protein
MSQFEEFLLWTWVILVTLIYPLYLFKGMRRLQEQLDRLNKKVQRQNLPQLPVEEKVPIRTPQPVSPPPLVQAPAPVVTAGPAVKVPPPLPFKAPLPPLREPGGFELAAKGLVSRIWNWILVGEEHRKPGVSVEFAVATNWLVRVGVLVLVVGVGFFLDYSARMGWLGDAGKVGVAVLAGAALTAAGMMNLNRKYHLLGQGLVGAGLAVLYTAMFAAYQRYGLIPPSLAFVAMFLVTLGGVGISLYSRSLLIAVLGIIGGYLTPFLLPDSGEVAGLLVYLAVLGGGVLLLSVRRQWFVLNVLAFLFTSLHTFALLVWWRDPLPFSLIMPFLLIYFLIFSTAAFLFQVVQKVKSTWLDLGFLLMNAGGFFLAAQYLIPRYYAREWVSLVTLLLALFYALHFYVFIKRKGEDRGLALSFMSLSSLFLLMSVPLYFSAAWWTFSWALLALVLLAASQKVQSRFLEQVGFGILMLSLLRLLQVDLAVAYGPAIVHGMPLSVYFSGFLQRLMQLGVPLLSIAGALWLQRHPLKAWTGFQLDEANDSATILPPDFSGWTLRAAGLGFGFLVLHLEVSRSFTYLFSPALPTLLTLVWVATGWVLLGWLKSEPSLKVFQYLLCGFVMALMAKWLFWDLSGWGLVVARGLFRPYTFVDAGFRFLDAGLRLGFLLLTFRYFLRVQLLPNLRQFFGYLALFSLWLYSTLEVNSLLAVFVPGLRSGGLSVFWGLFALSLVSAGLFKRFRPLRLIGLAMFMWVAIKVFFHDLASLDPIYKIVAFILLGIVILAGAYAYLRFQDRFALDSQTDSVNGDA